ncbi:MAG: 4-hydroxy-tetrahydrodipicolinate reductase [Alphaproteobacteria bacterium]
MIKIGVAGCSGRMGKSVVHAVLADEDVRLSGATVRKGSNNVGQDIGDVCLTKPTGILISDNNDDVFDQADIVIDFTLPEATIDHLKTAVRHKVPMVIGTTGLGKNQREDIFQASKEIPIVFSSNMSVGVTALTAVVEQVAALLDESFDIEVFEMHHRHKLDAPSGTAITLGQAAANGRGVSLAESAQRCRNGKRQTGEIGFASSRGGNVAGDHSVIFAGDHEVVTLNHRAFNREVFASGGVKAAKWLKSKAPGLYTMRDVLGI